MIIRTILFIFYLLHLDFLIRNLIFDTNSATFFGYELLFDFSKDDVVIAIFISVLFILSFYMGFKSSYFLSFHRKTNSQILNISSTRFFVGLFEVTLLIPIIYILSSIIQNGLDYGRLTSNRAVSGFFLELRIIPLILLSYIILNFSLTEVIKKRIFRRSIILLGIYFCLLILYQVRSLIFELAIIFLFRFIKINNDRFSLRYLWIIPFCIVIPNIIVLHRLGYPPFNLIDLLSFEYSIILNKFLITAVNSRELFHNQISNLDQLLLLIPSPLRALFDLDATQNAFFNDFSSFSGVSGGGFSLLAQLFTSYGYLSMGIMFVLGIFLGHFRLKMLKTNFSLIYSITPLLYGAFILSLRNDFMVFVKYSIQLLILASIFQLINNSFRKFKSHENFTYRSIDS